MVISVEFNTEEQPPSKLYLLFQDAKEEYLKPGVDPNSNLMSHLKQITKIIGKSMSHLKHVLHFQ
jgi:hypothetical protein